MQGGGAEAGCGGAEAGGGRREVVVERWEVVVRGICGQQTSKRKEKRTYLGREVDLPPSRLCFLRFPVVGSGGLVTK